MAGAALPEEEIILWDIEPLYQSLPNQGVGPQGLFGISAGDLIDVEAMGFYVGKFASPKLTPQIIDASRRNLARIEPAF